MDADELISRGALIEQLERLAVHEDDWRQSCILGIVHTIAKAPAVDAVEVDKAMAWLEGYTMTDTEQIYSNGTVFVPLYRVKQAFVDKAYNGLQEG